MVIGKLAAAAMMLTATLGLSGCSGLRVKVTGTIECSGGNCKEKGEIVIENKVQFIPGSNNDFSADIASANNLDLSLIDANALVIDTYGSTVQIPLSGNITFELRDSTSGSMLAARQFEWVKVGSELKLSNPAFVESWIQDNGAGADSVRYQLSSIPVTESSGTNVFAVAVNYAGETLRSASYAWSGSGGGACRDCQVQ